MSIKYRWDTNARIRFEAETLDEETATAYFQDALNKGMEGGLKIEVDSFLPVEAIEPDEDEVDNGPKIRE